MKFIRGMERVKEVLFLIMLICVFNKELYIFIILIDMVCVVELYIFCLFGLRCLYVLLFNF